MESSISKVTTLSGIHFLNEDVPAHSTYTPSEITEEHQMISDMVAEFIKEKIFPNVAKIEKQVDNIAAEYMEEVGALGILSAHIPESYGGMGMDFISNTMIAQQMGTCGSFSVAYNAHTGIGMLPILYFGTEDQKQQYLPKLSSGEWKASYCLTEPSSGSDALNAKSKADLSADGNSYIINGQKMWISNAGFADLFIVFAQVDGDKFSCFIVEAGAEGLTLGAEEDKLGIKGSSTRQVFFENVKVPKQNLLGEIGKGHLIAFNVLNIGRYKLGVSCLGGAKQLITESVSYANERKQFGTAIGNFGAIKYKIAEQNIRVYALESAVFRMAGFMDKKIKSLVSNGVTYGDAKLQAAEEFAIECSIIKVLGSEVLDYVVDEAVQVYGGMGYSEEGNIARAYRDSRINRIFEGTNEINRLLIVSMLYKKAMKGQYNIAEKAMNVQKELTSGEITTQDTDSPFPAERACMQGVKKLVHMLIGYAGQQSMNKAIDLKEAQEPVMNLSDILIDLYTAESLLLRAEKDGITDTNAAIVTSYYHDMSHRVYKNALDFIAATVDENAYPMFIKAAKSLCFYPIQNTMKSRRVVAEAASVSGGYVS